MSHIILDLAYNRTSGKFGPEQIVDLEQSRAYIVDYDQDSNPLEDDWVTGHLTTIEASFGVWVVGVGDVTLPQGHGNDYESQGGVTVACGLRAMEEFDQDKTPVELKDIFSRWMDRGIEIAALHAGDLSRPYVTPDHALPCDALLLVGDGAQSAAELINRVASGYVWNVGVCTLSELRDLMIESMELGDDETVWDMLEQLHDDDQTGIRPWECPDNVGSVIGNNDLLDVTDVRHLF